MPVILLKKDCPPYEFATKKEALRSLKKAGENPSDYRIRYVYEHMHRKPYSPGYEQRHREASARYYHRNYVPTGRPVGRPKTKFGGLVKDFSDSEFNPRTFYKRSKK